MSTIKLDGLIRYKVAFHSLILLEFLIKCCSSLLAGSTTYSGYSARSCARTIPAMDAVKAPQSALGHPGNKRCQQKGCIPPGQVCIVLGSRGTSDKRGGEGVFGGRGRAVQAWEGAGRGNRAGLCLIQNSI